VEILLLHPGGLGDIILSLPAVALLREHFPAARVTIAGNTDHLAPVVGGYAESAVSLSALPLHNLYADAVPPDSDIRFWRSFDLMVSWTGSGNPSFVQKMKAICPDARIASWRPDPKESRHVSQLFIDSLGPEIASGREAAHAPICVRRELSDQGTQWLLGQGWRAEEPLVALHPGAGSETKRWPLDRFIDLARYLTQAEKKRLVIVEGPAEPGLAVQIEQELREDRLIVAKSLSLSMLAAIIAKAELFVGNDSGMAHLAAALGTSAIALFGPTLPKHWAPLGPDVRILWDTRDCEGCNSGNATHTCLENITVEAALQAVKVRILHCSLHSSAL
jgi:ADP-heptose:LPS heptosyltransferase